MRALISKEAPGKYEVHLVDYDVEAEGSSFDNALYNLQSRMANHVLDCAENGVEHVWVPVPSHKAQRWEAAEPQMYCEAVFRFEGKRVELPTLEVRVVG